MIRGAVSAGWSMAGTPLDSPLARPGGLLPNLVTVLRWESCDYTGPVHEDDALCSELHIESPEPTDDGGVLGLRSLVYAVSDTAGEPDRPVLDWRFSALPFCSQEPNDARKLCRSTGSTIDHSTHDPLISP
jgi:hypothetical protein